MSMHLVLQALDGLEQRLAGPRGVTKLIDETLAHAEDARGILTTMSDKEAAIALDFTTRAIDRLCSVRYGWLVEHHNNLAELKSRISA